MKTLKTVMVLLFTAALIFSCAQENNDYGTLIINPSGNSARSITAEVGEGFYDGFEDGLTYTFECINQSDNTKVKTESYDVGKSNDVQIQLLPGKWEVWVKVHKNGKEIGSNKYDGTVTINAGQTVILGGLNVEVQGYSYGSAVAHKAPDGFDYKNVNNSTWSNTPPININRHLRIGSDGQAGEEIPFDENLAHGTARILWDDEYLYVLVLVEGAKCTTTQKDTALSNAHHTDSVELFFNEGGTGYQYRIDYAGKKTYGRSTGKGNYNNSETAFSEKSVDLSIIKDNLPDGEYLVVARIEFGSEKGSGDIIGIDLQINGAPINSGGNRSSIAIWHNKTSPYNDPTLYKETLALAD